MTPSRRTGFDDDADDVNHEFTTDVVPKSPKRDIGRENRDNDHAFDKEPVNVRKWKEWLAKLMLVPVVCSK